MFGLVTWCKSFTRCVRLRQICPIISHIAGARGFYFLFIFSLFALNFSEVFTPAAIAQIAKQHIMPDTSDYPKKPLARERMPQELMPRAIIDISRVSIALDGLQGPGDSTQSSISVDERSLMYDLFPHRRVESDTNDAGDIFVAKPKIYGVVGTFDCSTVTGIPEAECEALVALYNSTNGPNWKNNTGWLETNTPCNWYGVTCKDGHVQALHLSENRLSGSIPPEVGNLSYLETLSLWGNALRGNIPSQLGYLTKLRNLWLNQNQLEGSIPPPLGLLTKLELLYLWGNKLIGNIPLELGNLINLRELSLSQNQLSDSIPPPLGLLTKLELLYLWGNKLIGSIPLELGNLINLRELSLSQNQLSDSIPPQLGDLAKLEALSLWDNQLSGTIPHQLGNLAYLRILWLTDNRLSGNLPSQLGSLTNLEDIRLSRNKLTGIIPPQWGNPTKLRILWLSQNQLSGSIPPELGNLAKLQDLHLFSNKLSGIIPRELGNLDSLKTLWLDQNQLSGSIPLQLGNLTNLKLLYLWDNQLSGNIPQELGNLTNLQELSLSGNQLNGSIPSQLGNLINLRLLYLWDNQLSGNIPQELGNLTNLQELHLSGNQLSGSIPLRLGNLANLEKLYLQNNQLNGNISPQFGNLTNLTELSLYGNQLSGSIPPELGNLSSLKILWLTDNQLSGTIPLQLGNLTNLADLHLNGNKLEGGIPSQLGNLTKLEALSLSRNNLTGGVPSELGNLVNLQRLALYENPQLTGPLPMSLTKLTKLWRLWFQDTGLCEPPEPAFQAWLAGISDLKRSGIICESECIIPLPTYNTEVSHLWEDLQVPDAHIELCPMFPPGSRQKITIMDWEYGQFIDVDGRFRPKHGAYTSNLVAGPPGGSGYAPEDDGLKPGELPGIAAGATLQRITPYDFFKGNRNIFEWFCKVFNFSASCESMGAAIIDAFSAAISDSRPPDVVGIPMISWGWLPVLSGEPPRASYFNKEQALTFLDMVEAYTDSGGIVVLPSNFFILELAQDHDVREALKESGSLVAHALRGRDRPFNDLCEEADKFCATSRQEINIAVSTAHNSVAVPAVAGVVLLMKNANKLSGQEIRVRLLLSNEERVQINGGNMVPILNAYLAVKKAKE